MKPGTFFCAQSLISTLVLWGFSAGATLVDYQQAVTNETGLISYYTFDKTNANDSFGQNNGALAGTAKLAAGMGASGRGLVLDGAGRVTLGQVPAFNFPSGIGSVEAWIRPGWAGTLTAYNPCIFAARDGGPVTWSVHMNGDKSGIGVWNGSSYLPLAIPAPGTNWHHLVVTFDNSSALALAAIYWDGVSIGDRNQDLGTASTPTQLGSSAAAVTDEGWIGGLDEVAFYSAALSSASVQTHYQAFFVGTPPVLTRQPVGGTFLPGVALQLTVSATGPSLSYQWYKGNTALAGETGPALAFPNLSTNDAGVYHVDVSNPASKVTSSDASVVLAAVLSPRLLAYQSIITNESSLISYYTFDRLTVTDARSLHDGALQGTAYFSAGVAGGPDQGLLLDGSGFAEIGAVPDFDFAAGTGSVEAWVRADWTDIAYNPCLAADRNGGPVTWSLHLNSDKKALGLWNGTAYQTLQIPNAGTNWHHFVAVFDSGNLTIYWDGVLIGTTAEPLGSTPATVQLGSSSANLATEGWVGILDEAAFYADPLPMSAVAAHYAAFLGNAGPTITVQPSGGAFYPGIPFQLSVWATGSGLSYQWFKDGTILSDATNWFLPFVSLAATNAGTYSVAVSNAANKVTSASAVLLVDNNLTRYRTAVLQESSLVSYYTFDAADASDTKGTNNGTVNGTASFTGGVGQGADQALLLDGNGDVDLGSVPAFEFPNGTGTFEAWIRPDWTSDPGYDPCVAADRSGGPTDWSIHLARTRATIGNWNGSHFQSLGVGNTTGWHHYAVVFGTDQVTMYWDGEALGTFAQPINLGSGLTSQIGSSAPGTPAEGWIGAIDEAAFYDANLSPTAINSHFLAMVGGVTQPGLLFSLSNNQLTLTWPASSAGFTLEYADALPALTWIPIPGLTTNSTAIPVTNAHRFFRLRK
jgi:hypothetical protein